MSSDIAQVTTCLFGAAGAESDSSQNSPPDGEVTLATGDSLSRTVSVAAPDVALVAGQTLVATARKRAPELAPVIAATVQATLARIAADSAKLGDKLAFDEPEAARLLSLESHQLRDERLRGRITASVIVGRRIRYRREDLLEYLTRNRTEARLASCLGSEGAR